LKTKLINYKNFGECVEVTGDTCMFVVMVERGPRIIRFSGPDGENVFAELDDEGFETEFGYWYMRGGHRLWHSPEETPRTYTPDLDPVEWEETENGVHIVQKPNEYDIFQKEMDISFEGAWLKVVHSIKNMSRWPIEFSVWALSVMEAGGTLIVPQNTSVTGLLSNRNLIMWPYTDIRDKRAKLGNRFILVKNAKGESPFMFGQSNEHGYAAYAVHGDLFIKKFGFDPDAKYPDRGSSFESYCCDFMIEIESLSPLKTISPGEAHVHTEHWKLIRGAKAPETEEEAERLMQEAGMVGGS